DGTVRACNRHFATLLGYDTVEEALRAPIDDLYVDPADRERFLAEVTSRQRVSGYELALKRRDGRVVTVAADAVAHFGERGELARISGFFVDRTVQKA